MPGGLPRAGGAAEIRAGALRPLSDEQVQSDREVIGSRLASSRFDAGVARCHRRGEVQGMLRLGEIHASAALHFEASQQLDIALSNVFRLGAGRQRVGGKLRGRAKFGNSGAVQGLFHLVIAHMERLKG